MIEEQEKDNKREELLRAATKEEKAKLLKDINIQRSRSQTRIQKLEQ